MTLAKRRRVDQSLTADRSTLRDKGGVSISCRSPIADPNRRSRRGRCDARDTSNDRRVLRRSRQAWGSNLRPSCSLRLYLPTLRGIIPLRTPLMSVSIPFIPSVCSLFSDRHFSTYVPTDISPFVEDVPAL
jgi:hypothetical protein